MTQATKRELKPKLRFPEFRDEGEWEEKRLIDTVDKKVKWSFIGGPFGSNLKSSDYVADGIRIIQLQNIGDAEFFNDYKIFTSEEKANELLSNNIYPGDIILSKMGDPVGRACLIPDAHKRYVMCSDGIRLVVDEKLNSKYFIYSLINSIQFRSLVEKTATGSTRKRIGLDELKNLPMLMPKKIEQQKIADCLSSIDELVAAETQKLDTLKTHKKGLMQQLFPAEGETLPKLRFPEFRDAGEWEEKSIGGVCKTFSGGTPSTSEKGFYGGNTPFIRSAEIDKNQTELFLTDEGLANSSAKLVRKGDVLVALYGANSGEVALSKLDGAINQAILCLQSRSNNPFIYQYLCLKKDWIVSTYIQGGQGNLSGEIIKSIKLNFPSPEEQKSVADCLSSIDELIAAQTQKLATLKTHKKGLMQQFFPWADSKE